MMDKGDLFRLFYLVISPAVMLAVGFAVYWLAKRKMH